MIKLTGKLDPNGKKKFIYFTIRKLKAALWFTESKKVLMNDEELAEAADLTEAKSCIGGDAGL